MPFVRTIQTRHHLIARRVGGEKDDVHRRQVGKASNLPADLQAVDAGHVPVEEGDGRRLIGSKRGQSLSTVRALVWLVTPAQQVREEPEAQS